jgi:hypothetical protein
LRIPPRRAGERIDEGQRQLGEEANVEVDHGELLGMIELERLADQAEACIVDDVSRLDRMGGDLGFDRLSGVGSREVDRQHQRARTSRRGDLVGHGIELRFAPRDQHEVVSMIGEHPRQRGPDAG